MRRFKVLRDYTLICNRCGWFARFDRRVDTYIERILHRCVNIPTETNYGI